MLVITATGVPAVKVASLYGFPSVNENRTHEKKVSSVSRTSAPIAGTIAGNETGVDTGIQQ